MQYTHNVSTRARRVRLHLSPDGGVCVTTPPHTPKWLIDKFVADHHDWIQTAQNNQKKKNKLQTDTNIYLFGAKYSLVVTSESSDAPGFTINGSQIEFVPIVATQKAPTTTQLHRFLKSTAESYLIPRTTQLAETMQLCYKRISLKQQLSRWGSCSSQGNLNFNWRLVHFAPPVIDYVIIHELAHLVHQNHSSSFWQLVAQFDPQYKLHRKTLNRHYW